ncbi:hypothetical protein [Clostridium sp. CF012]|uniref:hypothetical protein n=1 Tax=Clostridium sp. CF012 TaxID=2843319 RepID=UPI001C0E010E|nr:hypothetical protein [Clostridium sp. CF012]MBU3146927.1 hypothetical protein [Clostridium sp. CF012]
MKCSYRENEMVKGVIDDDGSIQFRGIEDGEKIGLIDRILFGGKNVIVERHPFGKTILKCKKEKC